MIISFVGHSGSGKTTLIEKVIRILTERGIVIGTIKHTHHNFQIDREGKDSYRHFHAGAVASMIISEEKMAFIKRKEVLSAEYLANKYFSDCELVIVEGFKDDETLKIEVFRKELNREPLYKKLKNVIAVATDTSLDGIKNLNINSAEDIVDFILKISRL